MDFALQGSYNYVYLAISELYVELYSSLANELNLFRVYMKVSFMWIYLWSGFPSLNKSSFMWVATDSNDYRIKISFSLVLFTNRKCYHLFIVILHLGIV